MAGRLRRNGSSGSAQNHAFAALTRGFASTQFWRTAGIEGGMTYEQFQARVAPRTFEQFVPEIARMIRGESDVLWPGPCVFFTSSCGPDPTSPKQLPVTEPMLAHFRGATRDALLFYTARMRHIGVLRGRHLVLTGSTALTPVTPTGAAPRAFVGYWPAIATLNLPRWAETHVFEPGTKIAELKDWPKKLEATIARTRGRDISLVAGMPPWVLEFAETMLARSAENGTRPANLQALWPNLECFVHGGVPVTPFEKELRALLGPGVRFHEIYAAAEGFIAAQDADAAAGLRVIADRGLFFEFLPLADFDESRLEQLGPKAVPLTGVKAGVDYVLLMSTPAGLARYVVGDIVRFTSAEPPRLTYVGRTKLQLAAFGERVLEKDVTDALVTVCQRHHWLIVNFHVAPLFDVRLTGAARGRHEWWIELKPGTTETPTGPQMALELDAELQRLNREYATRRNTGRIDSPTVRLVMPGVFKHWLQFHGRWGGQNKMARCRSDRLVADELAQITKFAGD